MLTNIKGVCFDLDGTLVNSLPGLTQAVDAMLTSVNLPAAGEERVSTWIGNGASTLVKRALTWAGATPSSIELMQYRTAFDRYYVDTIEQGSQLYPDVIDTLEQLRQREIKMAIVTNKPSPFVPPLLQQLEIAHYFNIIIGGDDVTIRKPHPAPIYLILGRLGLRANELLVVGDSRNDIEAAKAATCPTAGLTYGYNYGEPIADSKPDYVLNNFKDILPTLGISTTKPN